MPTWTLTWLGMRKELDVTPLTVMQELQAILAGISTWQTKPAKPTFAIDYRIASTIQRHPADQVTVLNSHYCRTNEMIGSHPTYYQYPDFSYNVTKEPPF